MIGDRDRWLAIKRKSNGRRFSAGRCNHV